MNNENNEKNTPVAGDVEELECDVPEEKRPSFGKRVRASLPVALVLARYLFPALTATALVVMGFFKIVRFAYRPAMSLWRLIWNTIVGARDYFGGEMQEAKSWFYGTLSAAALAEVLLGLVALFLIGFATYLAIRSFTAGYKSERSNRAKLAFKVVFPNRVCLYLSNLLLVLPALYPHIFSWVSRKFLLIGGEEVVYVIENPLLIVMGACSLVTLVLAILSYRFERRLHMNMFALYHKASAAAEETEEMTEE